jgi:hypothetical protein
MKAQQRVPQKFRNIRRREFRDKTTKVQDDAILLYHIGSSKAQTQIPEPEKSQNKQLRP